MMVWRVVKFYVWGMCVKHVTKNKRICAANTDIEYVQEMGTQKVRHKTIMFRKSALKGRTKTNMLRMWTQKDKKRIVQEMDPKS